MLQSLLILYLFESDFAYVQIDCLYDFEVPVIVIHTNELEVRVIVVSRVANVVFVSILKLSLVRKSALVVESGHSLDESTLKRKGCLPRHDTCLLLRYSG